MSKDPVVPMLMQYAEPEYMCPVCGNKFYIYKNRDMKNPSECNLCHSPFIWKKG